MCSVIVPFGREVLNCMMIEIYPDHYDIHRYNVEDRREIKPDKLWQVPIPYKPENAKYTSERKNSRKAPEFPPDARAVIRYDFGYLYLIFDPAQHEDFTHFYNVKIQIIFFRVGPESRSQTKCMSIHFSLIIQNTFIGSTKLL